MCAKVTYKRSKELTEEEKIAYNKTHPDEPIFPFSKEDRVPGEIWSALIWVSNEINYSIVVNEEYIKNCKKLISLIDKTLLPQYQKLQTINIRTIQACINCAKSYLIFRENIAKSDDLLRRIIRKNSINTRPFPGTYTTPLKSFANKISDWLPIIESILELSETDIENYLTFLWKLSKEADQFNEIKNTITPNKRDYQKICKTFPGLWSLADQKLASSKTLFSKIDRLKCDGIGSLLTQDTWRQTEELSNEEMWRNIQIDLMKHYFSQ
jgi:hypothetical protein